jgi:hypothetical protein
MPWISSKKCEFEEASFRTFFYKSLERFVDRGFGNAWQVDLNIIHKAPKMIICNSKMASLDAT